MTEEENVGFIRKVVMGNSDMLVTVAAERDAGVVGFGSPVCKILGTKNNRAR